MAPKRRAEDTDKPAKAKRARLQVDESEVDSVRTLDDHRLHLYRADVYYLPGFADAETSQEWHDELAALSTWYQPTLKVYGKDVVQNRHIAAYATDPELNVKYSGTDVIMHHEYPPVLRRIQDLVEARVGVSFNHVMLNRYESGQIYIGNHRDNAENRVIASLSVGAERTFVMTYAPPARSPPEAADATGLRAKKWVLENGSLVVMQGETQRYWKHAIPKEAKVKGSRISLTFRQLRF